jgi:predicted nucleotide-binding protein (sugar kinase/HSP70/actin superfamily)
MGNVALAAKVLCQGLKIPYVAPEMNNKATLQTGSYYSPEEICLPFKLILGNFIQGIERGADTLLITGSCGPCRFGEYCELLMKILGKMGYRDLDYVVVDLSSEIGQREFMRRIRKISDASPVSKPAKLKALYTAFKAVELCDQIDAVACRMAGYEAKRGECRQILNACKTKAYACASPEETLGLLNFYKNKLEHIDLDQTKDPLKISIIGEIFTIIDPFSNLYIEDKLMDYGVWATLCSRQAGGQRHAAQTAQTQFKGYQQSGKAYLPDPLAGTARNASAKRYWQKRVAWTAQSRFFPWAACRKLSQNPFCLRFRPIWVCPS